jgi:HKD family nuclease
VGRQILNTAFVSKTRDIIDAEVELLVSPYSGSERTLIQVLVEEFSNPNWNVFQSAVAFASRTGNFPGLLKAMVDFAKRGGRIEMTFGADTFSGEGGSEYAAIKELLNATKKFPTAKISLYREPGRSFHPKLYLFANMDKKNARLIIGSSNWGGGGFHGNVEANVIIDLSLAKPAHARFFARVAELFSTYWQEAE